MRATSPDAVTGKIVSSLTPSGFCRPHNDALAAFLFMRYTMQMSIAAERSWLMVLIQLQQNRIAHQRALPE